MILPWLLVFVFGAMFGGLLERYSKDLREAMDFEEPTED